MPAEDLALTRMVHREVTRRYVDSSLLDVKAIHGVVYIRGTVKKIRGHDVDLKKEMEIIQRVLRGKAEIRDVIVDVNYR